MIWTLVALLAVLPSRPFQEDRELLDRRLETLRRILPDGPNPVADATLIRELGIVARLGGLDVAARPPVEAGARGSVIVDLRATGRFVEIDRFFRQVALSPRLIDVESLSLSAAEQVISVSAVLRLPYRPLAAALPAAPEGFRAPTGVPRFQADAYLRDQALAVLKAETIATLRRERRNPRLFLSELGAVIRERPVVVTHAQLGEEFLIRGLAAGQGPLRGLENRFERGFFRILEFLVARQGACYRFEVRGRSPIVGMEAELPLPAEDPFQQDEAPCRIDRDNSRTIEVKSGPRKGPLSLRLRDVDMADVFFVLHLLTAQAFIVDADVTGRVNLDLSRLTLDEAVAALEKSGLRFSEAGRIRRVSLGKGSSVRAVPKTGAPPVASFLLKRASIRDVLGIMTEADASLAALGPPGFLGKVSVYARDASLPDLRNSILEAAGLSEETEEGRRILMRPTGADEIMVPVAGAPPSPRLVISAQDLSVVEFDLAGVASDGERWIAFAYSPAGALYFYKAGDRLSDGTVQAVNSTDVVLETDDGPSRILLRGLTQ